MNLNNQILSNKFLLFLSPAKLNLGLKITKKLPNGYHELYTTFCLIDLFDEISIQITDNGKISLLDHNQAWYYQKDLAYKAADILKKYTNTTLGANIKVKKTIPSGSGLGGGSSNAATVLIALNQMWGTNLTNQELIKLGTELGADVAFFIYGKNAVATGIGEILTPTDIPELFFVLVTPDFHLSTKDVFNQHSKLNQSITTTTIQTESTNINPNNKDKTNNMHDIFSLIQNQSDYNLNINENNLGFDNDLLKAASVLKPDLEQIINHISIHGQVSMTGSGSTLYLTFTNKNIAKKVAKELASSYNTYLVSRLTQSPLYKENGL